MEKVAAIFVALMAIIKGKPLLIMLSSVFVCADTGHDYLHPALGHEQCLLELIDWSLPRKTSYQNKSYYEDAIKRRS